MLPEGWNRKCLDEVCDLIVDGTHFSPKSTSGPYKYITSKNIRFGVMDLSNVNYISEEEHREIFKRCPVAFGDVLLTKDGANTGNAALNELNEEYSLLSSVAVLRGNAKYTTNQFILQMLLSPRIQAKIKDEMAGQAITRLTLQKIKSFEIIIPPLPEQQKIAEILSTWDEAIEKLEKLIKKKKKRKSGLLETFFEDIRSKFKSIALDSVAEILPSNVDKKTHEGEVEVRLCNYVDVYKNNKITNNVDFMIATATEQEVQKFKIKKDDLIITKDSETAEDIAIPSYVAEEIDNLICGYHLTLVRADSRKLLGHFLYYFFLTERSKYYFYTMANGAIRFGLSVDAFKEAAIPLPDLGTQTKIINVLNECEEEIESTIRLINLLKNQKQGLMQKLLTGKKRVIL